MLHEQNIFLNNFDTVASAAAFPSITSSSWVWQFHYLGAFPVDYIIPRSLALSATSCVPLDLDSFSIRSPFTALKRRIKVAFILAAEYWEVFFIYHYRFFIVEAYSMALWDHCERFIDIPI